MKRTVKPLAHSVLVISSVIALANCGNAKSEDDSQTGTTVPRQKNAALSYTTLPATTAPKTVAPAAKTPLTTTTVAKLTTTTVANSPNPTLPSTTTALAALTTTTVASAPTPTPPVTKPSAKLPLDPKRLPPTTIKKP